MAREEVSNIQDDDSDFLELCDTSEFADDESLVQEIAANRTADNAGSSTMVNSRRHPSLSTSAISQAAQNSTDESDDDTANVRSRQARRRRTDRERNQDKKPHEKADTPTQSDKTEDADPLSEEGIGEPNDTGSVSGLPSSTKKITPNKPSGVDKNVIRERLGQTTAIHINRNFRGSVQALPGTCLAWDSGTINGYSPLSHVDRIRPFAGVMSQFRSPFPGTARNLHGVPIFNVPPLRPVHPIQSMQAARFLQERILRASFGGLQGPLLPSVSQAVLRRNQGRNRPYFVEKSNQSRPPNF